MPYQNANGEWIGDDGIPLAQSGAGDFTSYMPGYTPSTPYTSPVTQQPAVSSYPDYLAGYVPPQGQADAPAVPTAPSAGAGSSPYDYKPLPPLQFDTPKFRGLPSVPGVGSAPTFDFKAPSVSDALNDPGYQFRVQQGEGSLQRSAAARGTLNDSGTLKALIDYGQDAASQEYANVWNRQFGVAKQAFEPQMAQWQASNDRAGLGYTTDAAFTSHQNDLNYQAAWNKYMSDVDWQKWNASMAAGV